METIIIPTLNEAGRIELTLSKILFCFSDKKDLEIIVVDNGSSDSTLEIVRKFPVRLLNCPTPGKALAMKMGVETAQGDILVFIDGDNTYEPDGIIDIIELLRKTPARLIRANRFMSEKSSMPYFRLIGNKLISTFASIYSQTSTTDVLSGFYGISKNDFLMLDLQSSGFEIESEIYRKISQLNWPTQDLSVIYNGRKKSNLRPLTDGWKIFKSLLATS